MFCLMVMSGGLRGYNELKLLTFNKENDSIVIYQPKVDLKFINPLNEYSRAIGKKYKWVIPKLEFENIESEITKEELVNYVLKVIAEQLKFTTPLIYKGKELTVTEIFSSYFARKTFSQIMWDTYRFQEHEVSMFTGHIFQSSELTRSYINTKSMTKKRELFDKIKAPN